MAKYGAATTAAAYAYITIIESAGGRAVVASTQGSIIAEFDSPTGVLYPLALTRYSKGGVQLCLGYLISKPAFSSEEVRHQLYERCVEIVGPLTTKTLNGFPGFAVTRLNDPAVGASIAQLLGDIRKMAESLP